MKQQESTNKEELKSDGISVCEVETVVLGTGGERKKEEEEEEGDMRVYVCSHWVTWR